MSTAQEKGDPPRDCGRPHPQPYCSCVACIELREPGATWVKGLGWIVPLEKVASVLGRKGGSVTGKISPRKGEASAENGRKSKGRPRKT